MIVTVLAVYEFGDDGGFRKLDLESDSWICRLLSFDESAWYLITQKSNAS